MYFIERNLVFYLGDRVPLKQGETKDKGVMKKGSPGGNVGGRWIGSKK